MQHHVAVVAVANLLAAFVRTRFASCCFARMMIRKSRNATRAAQAQPGGGAAGTTRMRRRRRKIYCWGLCGSGSGNRSSSSSRRWWLRLHDGRESVASVDRVLQQITRFGRDKSRVYRYTFWRWKMEEDSYLFSSRLVFLRSRK